MLLNIAIATILILVTTAIHAAAMSLTLQVLHSAGVQQKHGLRNMKIYWTSAVVLLMFLATLLEVIVWALSYLLLNAMEGLEQAVYFSMVTFTTLGYGDIVLHERWRILASVEAAIGIIMFGWTTAIVLHAVQRIHAVPAARGG